ncbi:hypothetical protein GSI_04231 [Ganoderma sinense ZZ0214-1]|uniref:Uncharacterized protein n=1 Tax=Ganoderma sinense ZZ0214-1 TaxID=1077348 RepID=A0A2G8SJ70_9APHY|nr:hypothetical protein GSI_04231 [Ganoderma sinense ZZ0214-1]
MSSVQYSTNSPLITLPSNACSLVCRGWTKVAQRQLFHTITLSIWTRNGRNYYVLNNFLHFLRDNPNLAKYVRKVSLRVNGGRYCVGGVPRFVEDAVRNAPRLRTLTLSSMLLKSGGVSDEHPRATIDALQIGWSGFDTPDALLHILGKFARIRRLGIYDYEEISGKAAQPGFEVSPSLVPVVESVVVTSAPMYLNVLLQAALCASSLADGALTEIQVTLASPSGVTAFLLPCLEYARDHVILLALDVDRRMFRKYPATFGEPWDDLASCTALEFLTFYLEGDAEPKDEDCWWREDKDQGPYTEYVENVLGAYVRLLCSLPPSLCSVEFKVRQSVADEAGALQAILGAVAGGEHWGEADAALAGCPEFTFLDFLESSPDIAISVLNVTVCGGAGFLPSLGGFIPAVLSKVPRLRKLTLCYLILGCRNRPKTHSVDPPAYNDGHSSRASIDMLDFSNCCFDGHAHLFDILSHFSRIRLLNLHHTDSDEGSRGHQRNVSTQLHPSNVPAIENVMIHPLATCSLFPFLRSALCASSLPNGALKSIRCPASEYVFKRFLVPCLNGGQDHLRELHLDIDCYEFVRTQGTLPEQLNSLRSCLASCTALESITVAINGNRGAHRVSSAYVNTLRAMLSTYARVVCPPPRSVRVLVFRVHESFETDAVEDANG